MSRLTVGSLFSGIGGFDYAAQLLGMDVAWQVEIEPFARRVLTKHWGDIALHEDIRTVDVDGLRPVDILCGGWPCQGNSVAGKRRGHADERSGLFSEILRVVDGMAARPPWICLENVPGLVSVNGGRDFAHCIGELRRRGYVGCVRRLDAQYFGLAQRRQRLFFVAGLGARGLRAIQLVLEGGCRHPAPRREAGEKTACCLESGANRTGGTRPPGSTVDTAESLVAFQCQGNNVGPMGALRQGNGNVTGGVPFVAARQTGRGYWNDDGLAGLRAHPGGIAENLVAHTLRGEGFDASEDGTGRGVPLAIAFTERGRAQGRTLEAQEELAYALTNPGSGGRTHSRQILAGVVRRLTPTECERLQGFPDSWTCLCGRNEGRSVGDDLCRCADGPRYRALGNAVAIPCILWLLHRIQEASE